MAFELSWTWRDTDAHHIGVSCKRRVGIRVAVLLHTARVSVVRDFLDVWYKFAYISEGRTTIIFKTDE
jgi:hypothetical protein